ncbi:stage II sporulation protein D [Paenibacillus yanchengensis]|uniref:Stage II sporulation protein D n=1 Tax=Paenibacillus yanchengensis TaxID=2035833 RepID=A0ABW4YNE6_9BACL
MKGDSMQQYSKTRHAHNRKNRYRIHVRRSWWYWFSFGFVGGLLLFIVFYEPSYVATVLQTNESSESVTIANEKELIDEPAIVVEKQETHKKQNVPADTAKANRPNYEPVVAVYLQEEDKLEEVNLEEYILGVVAGEMPAEFELEALKAQAIAARTYIVRKLEQGADERLTERGADVSNTTRHQVYISKDKLQSYWPAAKQAQYSSKLQQAVEETTGQIVTYEGTPIEASYFSTSNGHTEKAADYWGSDYPYLQSVASPWDKQLSPRYKDQVTLSLHQFYERLGLSGKQASKKPKLKVTEWTAGKRIKTMTINSIPFSGKEVREKLELRSSHFDWDVSKREITLTTYGFGHGVGMSQWGANGMAKEGYTAAEIIAYYYKDTSIEQVSKLAKNNSY